MIIKTEQVISSVDKMTTYEIHIRDLSTAEFNTVVAALNHIIGHPPRPQTPASSEPDSPPVCSSKRDGFEVVFKDGRWHVMSLEDGKSKGNFDNKSSALNHLDYIEEMRDYHKRGGPL